MAMASSLPQGPAPPGPRAGAVLSVQSHTVHGYVGNKAATFPMQLLGLEVDPVNSVHLSNHVGYAGGFRGTTSTGEELSAIADGLDANGLLASYTHLLTGYARDASFLRALAALAKRLKAESPDLYFFCDPVLGDNGQFYVPPELVPIYVEELLPLASIITPNQFEAEKLSGVGIACEADAARAVDALHRTGVPRVVVTSLEFKNDGAGPEEAAAIWMLCSEAGAAGAAGPLARIEALPRRYWLKLPRLERSFVGCGDLFASLLLSWLHRGHPGPCRFPAAAERAAGAMQGVLARTLASGNEELRIVQSAGDILRPVPAWRAAPAMARYDGVIFDMDGTLTEPGHIDFKAMRAAAGIPPGADILKHVNAMPDAAARAAAHAAVERCEAEGIERMRLRPHLRPIVAELRERRVRMAIATRNNAKALDRFLEVAELKGCRGGGGDGTDEEAFFSPAMDRDALPVNKPDPAVARKALDEWGMGGRPERALFVGDHADDIACGQAAGCATCLIRTPDTTPEALAMADWVVDDLVQVAEIVLGITSRGSARAYQ